MNQIHISHVHPSKLEPNSWNQNEVDERTLAKIERSLQRVGCVLPLVVFQRADRDRMTIINGEHRWRLMKKLGFEQVPVVKLDVTLREARKLTINLNELGGDPDPARYGKALQWFLDKGMGLEELEAELPLVRPEIEELLAEFRGEIQDSVEEAEKERAADVKRVTTERVHTINLGPFTRDEVSEVESILSDSALSQWPETELLLKLLRRGSKSLKRSLETS